MPVKASPEKSRHVNGGGNGCAWTANGLPLGQWSMMGEPIACKLDPGLQSFDVDLQQRTSYVIHSLSAGLEVAQGD
ncbi:unnamed protein product [Malus baccata var. baccata]